MQLPDLEHGFASLQEAWNSWLQAPAVIREIGPVADRQAAQLAWEEQAGQLAVDLQKLADQWAGAWAWGILRGQKIKLKEEEVLDWTQVATDDVAESVLLSTGKLALQGSLNLLAAEVEALKYAREKLRRNPDAWNRYLQIRGLHAWRRQDSEWKFDPLSDLPLAARLRFQGGETLDDWQTSGARALGQQYKDNAEKP